MRAKTGFHLLASALLVTLAGTTCAALPAEVDGQALPSLAPMLERVTPAVVNVHSRTRVRVRNPLMDDPFFRHFFGLPNAPQERIQQSLGSGVVVDAEQGLVLTNHHVIAGAEDILVTLADGRTLNATFVGADPDTDVAVVRVPAENLDALALADSSRLRVGDFVVAVGNPFGLGQTVTSGIVSALGRTGLRGLGYQNFIQTDASINPGNSGGALVNLHGELVGINTAIYTPSGGNVGIGFAIPSDLAREIMSQLLAHGEVRRGTLGVQAQDLNEELAAMLQVPASSGAVVTRVLPDSPAEAAGLRPGDVIRELAGRSVRSRADLANAEGLAPLGESIRLRFLREGRERELQLGLQAPRESRVAGATIDPRLAGAWLSDLPETLRRQGVRGVRVERVDPGSTALGAGLRADDIIVALNRLEVVDMGTLEHALPRSESPAALTVQRGRRLLRLLL
ncbi:MAG TPA: Do family serine endopeptidase [Xanthomonadaceae bacterium]|nr:Do family serine endopeptidase [Xanthomonadaceae bacterium]